MSSVIMKKGVKTVSAAFRRSWNTARHLCGLAVRRAKRAVTIHLLQVIRLGKLVPPRRRFLAKVTDRARRMRELGFKGLLPIKQPAVIGLDIGSSAVKAVRLQKDASGMTIKAAAFVPIVPGEEYPDNRGHGAGRAQQISEAVRGCLKTTDNRTKLVVCGLSGPEVAVRCFEFPPLPPHEIQQAVRLEAAQVCPFGGDKHSVDYQVTGQNETSVSGVLVAATEAIIQRKTRLAETAAATCVLMDVDGLALLNCLGQYQNEGAGTRETAVLSVGNSCTTIAACDRDGKPFVRDIAFGGNDIITSAARKIGISPEAVREAICDFNDVTSDGSKLTAVLDLACRRLASEVAKTLKYYAAERKTPPVKRLLVCGGFALVDGLVKLLDERLPLEVVVWNPFETMGCAANRQQLDVIQRYGPAMAVAVGLAMRSI